MLLRMSDNFSGPGRDDFRTRVLSDAEKDQQEIQDWLNANGGMVMAAIVIFVVLMFVVRLFT